MIFKIQPIDFRLQAIRRIAMQYRNKPLFNGLVSGMAGIVEDRLEDQAANLFDILDIDKMDGHNLDVIGEIVGQPRTTLDYAALAFFGVAEYTPPEFAGTFGDSANPSTGERMLSFYEGAASTVRLMSDAEYRTFIRARIYKNYSDGTVANIADAIRLIFDGVNRSKVEQVLITEGDMQLAISLLGSVSTNDLLFIQNYDVIPRPTGVRIDSVGTHKLVRFGTDLGSNVYFAGVIGGLFTAELIELRARIWNTTGVGVIVKTNIFGLRIVQGKLQAQIGATTYVTTDLSVSDGVFHTVSLIRRSGITSIRIDGVETVINTNTDIIIPGISYLTAGGGGGGTVFDVSFSVEGVNQIRWKGTDGSGSTWADSSGNGRDGAINNGTWVTTLE